MKDIILPISCKTKDKIIMVFKIILFGAIPILAAIFIVPQDPPGFIFYFVCWIPVLLLILIIKDNWGYKFPRIRCRCDKK